MSTRLTTRLKQLASEDEELGCDGKSTLKPVIYTSSVYCFKRGSDQDNLPDSSWAGGAPSVGD